MASSSTARQNQTKRKNAFGEIAPCSAPKSARPWDIFINHCLADAKKTLAANIYHKLHSIGLDVFLDVEALEFGDSIPAQVQHAIISAALHIAIFSPNYAKSPWCLAELSFMLKSGAKIITIFYHVDPSDLRYIDQGKGIYVSAFSEHENKGRYKREKLDEWKRALHNSSFLSGYLVSNNEDEATVLKSIVNCALKIMKKDPLWVDEHPIGLDELVQKFESVAGEETVNIRGIVGMGGSGKTTLAKEIFNRKSSSFKRCSFVFDVRDAASRNALLDRQIKILKDLGVHHSSFDHEDEGKACLANHLSSHRAFIVLDDVDHIDQLNALLPNKDKLGSHSLVIVTTRDLGVLISWGLSDSCIYRMPGLNWLHAQQLFCWHAFLQPSPPAEFGTLVEEFLKACNGLPLSLKVLGTHLYGRKSKDYWKSQLQKILRILPRGIQRSLKVSYDALDEEEREMFLDVACFFIGEKISTAIAVWDGSGWSGMNGLETLVNKCLVELVDAPNYDGKTLIRMHDHLRNMGREIASRHSPYRLWCPQQIDNMKKHSMKRNYIGGTKAVSTGIKKWKSYGTNNRAGKFCHVHSSEMELGDSSTSTSWQKKRRPLHPFDGVRPQRSAASSTVMKKGPWDVFTNHRGCDTKHTLARSIYHTLETYGFRVFLDEKDLDLGNSISEEIKEAIRTAGVYIAIFSERHAESPLCLAELSYMLEPGTTILPIFYHVDPSDLRWVAQGKGLYAPAFSHLKKKRNNSSKMLREWKTALERVSNLSGQVLNSTTGDEGMLLKSIVNSVLKAIKKEPLEVAKHPVGMDEIVEDFEISRQEHNEREQQVEIVGIVGFGGSGKTTLATELYNRKSSSFNRSSFLNDVRDAASKNALHTK